MVTLVRVAFPVVLTVRLPSTTTELVVPCMFTLAAVMVRSPALPPPALTVTVPPAAIVTSLVPELSVKLPLPVTPVDDIRIVALGAVSVTVRDTPLVVVACTLPLIIV